MIINFKKFHPDAKMPTRGRSGDACFDLYATEVLGWLNGFYRVKLGIGFEIPQHKVVKIYPRSGISNKGLILSNSIGVGDSNFVGEYEARFYSPNGWYRPVKVGERIAQMEIQGVTDIEFVEVDELNETNRGANGYGSSGEF